MVLSQKAKKYRDTIVSNLREKRRAKNITLEKMAKSLARYGAGFTVSQLSLIERGKRGVDIGELPLLCRALGVDQSEVMPSE